MFVSISVRYEAERTHTFIFASGLSEDDESPLLRLFLFPYRLKFHCCKVICVC